MQAIIFVAVMRTEVFMPKRTVSPTFKESKHNLMRTSTLRQAASAITYA